jgi:hypothetical protein
MQLLAHQLYKKLQPKGEIDFTVSPFIFAAMTVAIDAKGCSDFAVECDFFAEYFHGRKR